MEKKVVLIEFGHWYEIPTFYQFLKEEVVKRSMTPIFYSFDEIPEYIKSNWLFFNESEIFFLKDFKSVKIFLANIKKKDVSTFFLKTPHKYLNLAILNYFDKLEVPSYTIITSLLGEHTYNKYFAVDSKSSGPVQQKNRFREYLKVELLRDLFHRISVEITRFLPLFFSLSIPKSYFLSSMRNYHQYINENKSTYLVPTTEEVLILKKFFPNQSVESYIHPFLYVDRVKEAQDSHHIFFLEFFDTLPDLDFILGGIREILYSKNISLFDKIVFQFHPRQPSNFAHLITEVLKKNFINSEFGNNEIFDNLQLLLSKALMVFTPVSTAAKLASFYRPEIRVIIYEPLLRKNILPKNMLAGTPNGPIIYNSIESFPLGKFIF